MINFVENLRFRSELKRKVAMRPGESNSFDSFNSGSAKYDVHIRRIFGPVIGLASVIETGDTSSVDYHSNILWTRINTSEGHSTIISAVGLQNLRKKIHSSIPTSVPMVSSKPVSC